MRYIIDTNIITAIMKNNEKVKRRAQEAILTGDDVFINGEGGRPVTPYTHHKSAKIIIELITVKLCFLLTTVLLIEL